MLPRPPSPAPRPIARPAHIARLPDRRAHAPKNTDARDRSRALARLDLFVDPQPAYFTPHPYDCVVFVSTARFDRIASSACCTYTVSPADGGF